jgi:hypothetical protein
MLKSLLITVTAVGIVAGVTAATTFASSAGNADQTNARVVTIPTTRTTPVSGQLMYGNYCAACHGVKGKGNGPAGVALRWPRSSGSRRISRNSAAILTTDLTLLSKNNGGKFPSNHVETILQHGTGIEAHGASDMPVWGPVLGKMDQANPQARQLRISNLSSYLETIQAK